MHLQQLIDRLPGVSARSSRVTVPGTEIRGVTSDPDRAGPDTLFAAIPSRLASDPLGTQTAVGRGAPAVICRPGTLLPPGTQRIVVDQPGRAFSDAAAALNGNPLSRLHLLRVRLPGRLSGAGAAFLHQLLGQAGQRSALLTADGGIVAGRHFPQAPCETDSHEWQRLLAAHVRAGGTTLVVEDDPAVDSVLGSASPLSSRVVQEAGGARIEAAALHWRGSRVRVRCGGAERLAHLPLVGQGALLALDAALEAALAVGADPVRLTAGLPGIQAAPGLLEPVQAGQPFGVFVDGARDADSLRDLLRDARQATQGQILLVIGATADTTAEERRALGEAASLADRLVLTADNPRRAGFAAITSEVLRGTTRAAQVESDRQKAIHSAVRQARNGDVVLLAGKARRPVQELDGTILPWDDRTHARDALATRGWIGDLE